MRSEAGADKRSHQNDERCEWRCISGVVRACTFLTSRCPRIDGWSVSSQSDLEAAYRHDSLDKARVTKACAQCFLLLLLLLSKQRSGRAYVCMCEIQAHKRFKRTLFIRMKHNLQIFRVIRRLVVVLATGFYMCVQFAGRV